MKEHGSWLQMKNKFHQTKDWLRIIFEAVKGDGN